MSKEGIGDGRASNGQTEAWLQAGLTNSVMGPIQPGEKKKTAAYAGQMKGWFNAYKPDI